ncbi:MAG: GDP-mannose 4,6-dehydratase [Chloroflexi bacterium]|nr:GDP-mannose 4,6-dehydratase [Chloroflexota bacterium]
MARYLVTGAAGFIGAQVAAELLARGDQVVGVDNLNDAYDPRLKDWRLQRLLPNAAFHFERLDISEADALAPLPGLGPFDAVINLAARAGVRASVRFPELYTRTNTIGALHLLELCRSQGIPKFVQASTSSLYGAHNPRPFREDADISRPLSPYAATKGAAELLCHSFHALHGLDVTILRYFTVFGPAGRPEMSIFRFIQWVEESRPVVMYGDGQQERDFTYVDDIVRGTLAALRPLDFEVINLGSDRPVTLRALLQTIERLAGKPAVLDQRPDAPGDVRATWADISKAGKLLGWEPRVDLETGLRACVDWYRAERAWASSIATSD